MAITAPFWEGKVHTFAYLAAKVVKFFQKTLFFARKMLIHARI